MGNTLKNWARGLGIVLALAATSSYGSGSAPQISGTPSTEAVVGQLYNFKARTVDAEGDTLTFAIKSKPRWTRFSERTGRLWGTPPAHQVGSHEDITITVSDGTSTRELPKFNIVVTGEPVVSHPRKANYGHYFATRYEDTPDDLAMLCGQAGVKGVVWRRTWKEVEPAPGVYDFSSYDEVLRAIAGSHNPQCQLWIFVEFKSFNVSKVKNPCPVYLQAKHSALNADRGNAATCFIWEPTVLNAYVAMMKAAAARYNSNPRVEGFIVQESSLGFNGEYSQDKAAGGTYTAAAWRDALVEIVGECGEAFTQSRCMAYLNFIRGGQQYLHDVSAAIANVPNNRGCMSGPDLLPNSTALYSTKDSVYEVLTRHRGCRSNSAQNMSYGVKNCGLDCIFKFAVRGTFGDFDKESPHTSGVCVNSYLFWNHRVGASWTGLDWTDALPVIAAYPYGREWQEQCIGGGDTP